MGIIEASLRKQVRVGEEVDVTLIGGREMRGRVLAIAEDGLLLGEGDLERPIAFAGIATFAPTRQIRREAPAALPPQEAAPAGAADEPEAPVERAEGWVDRYDEAAGVGSLALEDGARAAFAAGDVADAALRQRLERWTGRAVPVTAELRKQGQARAVVRVEGRETEEKFRPAPAAEGELPREGFGE
ncbi:MAG: hypothetical protein ACOX83_12100, partial [Candidatus Spyradocola sp.]